MNFRDRWETNEAGDRFVFTVEMQRKLSQAGLPVVPTALVDLPGSVGRSPEPTRSERPVAPSRAREPERGNRVTPDSPSANDIEGPESIQIDPQTGKYVGQIKWYNTKKGYGFIMRGEGEEIFFHRSAVLGDMEEFADGQWVLYDVETTGKGPEATDVEPYDGEPIA
jgi:CspA family cold shock protein